MKIGINKNASNEAVSRLVTLKRVFEFYAKQRNLKAPSQRMVSFVASKIDEACGHETRLRFMTWLAGRKVQTSKIEGGMLAAAFEAASEGKIKVKATTADNKNLYGITGAEAFALVMLFRPTKTITWTFADEHQSAKDMQYIKQGFEKTAQTKP